MVRTADCSSVPSPVGHRRWAEPRRRCALSPLVGEVASGKKSLPDAVTDANKTTVDEMERRYVRQVLASVNGNKTHAARVLGIDRRSLYRRLEAPTTTSSPERA